MSMQAPFIIILAVIFALALTGAAYAHHPDHQESVAVDGDRAKKRHLLHDTDLPDGHVPANVNYGFALVGHDALDGITDGKCTDVC